MGLVIDIKGWPVEALVAMATEGISVSYGEVICGGDKSLDRKIGRMLDKGKVLAAVDKLPEHLSSWLLVAYAAPGYISEGRAQSFYDIVMGEFIARYIDSEIYLPKNKWELFSKIIPLICFDVARNGGNDNKKFKPKEYVLAMSNIESFNPSTLRKNWNRDWRSVIQLTREILLTWDYLSKVSIMAEINR